MRRGRPLVGQGSAEARSDGLRAGVDEIGIARPRRAAMVRQAGAHMCRCRCNSRAMHRRSRPSLQTPDTRRASSAAATPPVDGARGRLPRTRRGDRPRDAERGSRPQDVDVPLGVFQVRIRMHLRRSRARAERPTPTGCANARSRWSSAPRMCVDDAAEARDGLRQDLERAAGRHAS